MADNPVIGVERDVYPGPGQKHRLVINGNLGSRLHDDEADAIELLASKPLLREADPAVGEASWRLTTTDIANGGGIAIVTLHSGVQHAGRVDKRLSAHEVLHMRTVNLDDRQLGRPLDTDGGWVTIDWGQIASIQGVPA